MLDGGLGDYSSRIISGGHAPRTGIALREAHEIRTVGGRTRDVAEGIINVFLIRPGAMSNRLNDSDAECHGLILAVSTCRSTAKLKRWHAAVKLDPE